MDKITFRILLCILGFFEVILLVGALLLTYFNKTVPDFVTTAIPSVLTGMLGLAIRTSPNEPVQVINPPGDTIDVAVPLNGGDHRADPGAGLQI